MRRHLPITTLQIISVLMWCFTGLSQAADSSAPSTANEQLASSTEGGDVPPESGVVQERAIKKIVAGHTYCVCTCTAGTTVLMWEKVKSCAINGARCTGGGQPGVLRDCNQCTPIKNGEMSGCSPAKSIAGETTAPMPEPEIAPPPPQPPKLPPTGIEQPPTTVR